MAGGLMVIGTVVLWPSWYAVGWMGLYGIVGHVMVVTEEEHLLEVVGKEYARYSRRVPRYVGRWWSREKEVPMSPSDVGRQTTSDARRQFEVVTVNELGGIVERRTETAWQFVENLDGGVSLDMVLIPGGTFLMGSRAGYGYDDERPQHSVTVSPFLMGKYPVTQEQWEAVMEWIPPYRCTGRRRPVDRVSWDDARAFCERLSARTGRGYCLPGESEWEYACRAGTTTPFYCGETITTDLANYVGDHVYRSGPKGVYRHETTDVGSFPANAFGLYDMHGNVWEWCADAWHDNYAGAPADGSIWEGRAGSPRVLRGGCWHDPPDLCRSAARLKNAPHEGEDLFGFRVALASLERST